MLELRRISGEVIGMWLEIEATDGGTFLEVRR